VTASPTALFSLLLRVNYYARLRRPLQLRSFAEALADFRAPLRGENEKKKRDPRKLEHCYKLPSTRQLEGCSDLPGRNEISEWENGKGTFDEQQVRAYLRLCHITGELLEACIRHYWRIIASATAYPNAQDSAIGETASAAAELRTAGLEAPDTSDIELGLVCNCADLVFCLQQLHVKAGCPSYHLLSHRAEEFGERLPVSTIAALVGKRAQTNPMRPSWKTVRLFLQACGIPETDHVDWRQAWERAMAPTKPNLIIANHATEPVDHKTNPNVGVSRRNEISYPPGGIIEPATCDDAHFDGLVVPFRLHSA
jgi:hypothetical protein